VTDFLGSEVLVDAVIVKLQAEMLARVAKINLQNDDEVTIVAPNNDRYFTAALRLIPPPGPAILVMDGPMKLQRGGEGPHSLLTNTVVGVWVMDEDSDEQRLGRRLQRLSRAVIESLWDGAPQEMLVDVNGNQVGYNLRPGDTVPGPAFEPDHGDGPGLREFYLTTFTISRVEG
jgi:hypothetical protein